MRILIDNDGETIFEYEDAFPTEIRVPASSDIPAIRRLINEALRAYLDQDQSVELDHLRRLMLMDRHEADEK